MKKIIIGLTLLALLFVTPITAFASVSDYVTPKWIDCRGANLYGHMEIAGAIGQSTIVISWTSPPSDWKNIGRCLSIPFDQSEVTAIPNIIGKTGVPTTIICHSTSCADGFTIMVLLFVGHGYIQVPHQLQYGDHVSISITDDYANGESVHYGSADFKATS